MVDNMNEITQFSPYGGELILESVLGSNNQFITAENSISTAAGIDRDMYAYIPKSGCPDAKQGQVLMVLRGDASKESAVEIMERYGLAELAEKKHFILLFPNPQKAGWNYREEGDLDDDMAFLVRCFATLPKSKGGVAGFNGMIFYLSVCEAGSALLAQMSARHPIDCAAIMAGAFPPDYQLPKDGLMQPQVAWVYERNEALCDYLARVNQPGESQTADGVSVFTNGTNRNIRHFISEEPLTVELVEKAWDRMFSEARRWRNDTYGTYQERTNFTEEGFIPHVQDSSLGVNDGFAHTWYEYMPPQVRNSDKKVPLMFYFHGGNCIPLYGAEQSGWHKIAKEEGFIVVYPKASIEKVWNVWGEADQPSDFAFVLALIEHMKKNYPIDESRIYISGFSMGSMMTNALACIYPEIFAAAAPFNAEHFGYFTTKKTMPYKRNPKAAEGIAEEILNTPSRTKLMADEKNREGRYRMPVIQNSGLLDSLGADAWPIRSADNLWLETIDYWKAFNHIPVAEFQYSDAYETGLTADESCYVGEDERFILHKWYSKDPEGLPLYQMMVAKRMPHAVDLRQVRYAWKFIREYSRNEDGSLKHTSL